MLGWKGSLFVRQRLLRELRMLSVRDSFERKYPFPDGETHVLRGRKATVANFRRQAPQHRWLHVATHGFFAPQGLRSALSVDASPALPEAGSSQTGGVEGYHPGLLSGLVFSGANREAGPGQEESVLTALEAAELNLGKVEMAVLSACETGLGAEAGGEGLLGLQRAFQVAGARTVVASLWAVDDKAARSLMEDFYENLWQKNLSRLEAMRRAQRRMLEEGFTRGMVRRDKDGPKRVPPYYWAAFVLSGDWR